MAEDAFDKPAVDENEPTRDEDLEQSPAQQIQPPFLSEGPELMRDSHC
jgi:hypothetical protein